MRGRIRPRPAAGAVALRDERQRDRGVEAAPPHGKQESGTVGASLVSELVALQWRHLRLDGSEPAVRVRRAIVRGRDHPPKSRNGRRNVPLEAG